MTVRILIEEPARTDMTEAVHWSRQIRHGMENDLRLCIEETFDRIIDNPEHYPVVDEKLRGALISRFPFMIIYIIHEPLIRVIGVLHMVQHRADTGSHKP